MFPRFSDANGQRKSIFLVALMVMFSMAPVLTSPLVSSHGNSSITSWPLNGSNDTGSQMTHGHREILSLSVKTFVALLQNCIGLFLRVL